MDNLPLDYVTTPFGCLKASCFDPTVRAFSGNTPFVDVKASCFVSTI